MTKPDAVRLCLYLNASHRQHGKPLYQEAVETARVLGGAGASVFPVDLSYGARGNVHDARSEYLSFDIPVVVEVVDSPGRIDSLRSTLGSVVADGLTTAEPVEVVHYSHHQADQGRSAAGIVPIGPVPEHSDGGGSLMSIEGEALRVTIYIGSTDTWHGHNLAMAIVERCRREGIAGATASLGLMGFGKHSCIHRAHLFGLSQDVPEKVEIVDRPEQIDRIMPILREMVDGGLIIQQDVRAIRHTSHSDPR